MSKISYAATIKHDLSWGANVWGGVLREIVTKNQDFLQQGFHVPWHGSSLINIFYLRRKILIILYMHDKFGNTKGITNYGVDRIC